MLMGLEEHRYEKCPICNSLIVPWRTKRIGQESYEIDQCKSCNFAFVNPRPSMEFIMEFYSRDGHGGANGPAPTLASIMERERQDPNSTVDAARIVKRISILLEGDESRPFLDVGFGYGFFSKEAQLAGFDVHALELAETERKIGRELTGINATPSSFEDYNCTPGSMNVVLMSQILEHARDVNAWLKKANEILAVDGIIAIALPNFGSVFRLLMQENEPFICPPAHLNFFSFQSLSRLLEKHNFRIEASESVSHIPKRAIEKRIPSVVAPLFPAAKVAAAAGEKIMDAMGLGLMINVYGRKVG